MKIIFVSYSYWPPDFGGELLISIERFRSLAARGWEITVLTSGRSGFPSYQSDKGLKIWRSPRIGNRRILRLLRRIVFWWWAMWKLSRLEYAVIHLGDVPGIGPLTTGVMAQSFCRVAAARGAASVAVHSLADSDQVSFESHGWRGFWRRAFFERVSRIVAVSPMLYQGLVGHFGARVKLIPCGIRDDLFAPNPQARAARRAACGLQENQVVFLFLGSVGRRKGFDLLAQAFADLAVQYPEWRLWVIGPHTRAESQNLNEQQVAEITRPLRGLESRVVFWGRVDERHELSQILNGGDIFVFPSRREGMGIAPMEAMAVGLPVIIARIPEVTDLASIEEETGLYVTPGDLSSLKIAMQRLGAAEILRREMGAHAVERIRQNFGWQKYIDTWTDLYSGKRCTSE